MLRFALDNTVAFEFDDQGCKVNLVSGVCARFPNLKFQHQFILEFNQDQMKGLILWLQGFKKAHRNQNQKLYQLKRGTIYKILASNMQPQCSHWMEAMQEEMRAPIKNQMWALVPPRRGQELILLKVPVLL